MCCPIYFSRLPVKRVPPLSSFADEETDTQKSEGHRQLEVTDLRFRFGAVLQGWREGVKILQSTKGGCEKTTGPE